jgi:hypothetical protein
MLHKLQAVRDKGIRHTFQGCRDYGDVRTPRGPDGTADPAHGTRVVTQHRMRRGLLTAVVVAVGLVGCGGGGGDRSDVVRVGGVEYVLECVAVRPEARADEVSGQYQTAAGKSGGVVETYRLADLPRRLIIAVTGPADVLCPRAEVPGTGVAFSSETDLGTVRELIRPHLADPGGDR